MSRFGDYDGDGEDSFNGAGWAMWEKRADLALRGKRGRKALTDLREALLALPEKRLIEGALCTVGLHDRLAAMPEKVEREIQPIARNEDGSIKRDAAGGAIFESPRVELVENHERTDLADFVADYTQPEGVCAIGAYVWFQKVKAGMDPAEAFAALPIIPDADGDGGYATADIGKEHGLTYTLAWELASKNDETFAGISPEQRHVSFLTWIDRQLAEPPLKRPEPRPKRQPRAARRARPASQPAAGALELGL